MTLLDLLRNEHREFLSLLERLDRAVTSGSKDAVGLLGDLIERLERHEAVEEKLLWPAVRAFAPDAVPALEVIDADHAGIARVMQIFRAELAAAGRSAAWLILGSARLANMLRSHIAREEADLFGIAARRIPVAELERLVGEVAALRRVK